jgi:hypothetical protein
VTGRLRLTRAGTTVKSYYWKTGAPDGQWILVNTATLTNTPWLLVLYEGDNSPANAGPAASYSVTFSNLQVTSPGPTDAGTGIGPLVDSGASDAPDTAIAADVRGDVSGAMAVPDATSIVKYDGGGGTACNPSFTVPLVTAFGGSCYTGAVTVVRFIDAAAFASYLSNQVRVVGFDDVDTTLSSAPVAIAADRYAASYGIVIAGEGGGGQYVDDSFGWPLEYVPVSCPNMYSPGPTALNETTAPRATNVTFQTDSGAPGCVAGFGAEFIDVDFTDIAHSSLAVSDPAGAQLDLDSGFSSSNGGHLFRGMVTTDAAGHVVSAIGSARLVNGNVFPPSSCCEGATLDNFTLTGVVPH